MAGEAGARGHLSCLVLGVFLLGGLTGCGEAADEGEADPGNGRAAPEEDARGAEEPQPVTDEAEEDGPAGGERALPPLPGEWQPVAGSGLHLVLRPALEGEGPITEDHRRAHQVALHVPRGGAVSPFLPAGPFVATWKGAVVVPLRDRFTFRAEGKGSLVVEIAGKTVLEGRVDPGAPLESRPQRLRKGDNELRVVLTGDPLGSTSLRLWWKGTEFPYEPLHAGHTTHDRAHPALERMARWRHGRQVFAERRCAACHRPEGEWPAGAMPGLRDEGPALAGIGARLRGAWVAEWLRGPREVRPQARMPHLLGGEGAAGRARDLAAHLVAGGEPPPPPALGEERVAAGEERFIGLGCLACHTHPKAPGAGIDRGDRIDLGHVGRKWHPGALVEFLKDPVAVDPSSRMPDFRLSDREAEELVAFLVAGSGPEEFEGGDAGRGAGLVAEKRCLACHEPQKLEDPRAPGLAAVAGRAEDGAGCLAPEPEGVPDFGLGEEERAAVAGFLAHATGSLGRRVPLELAERQLEGARCTACHTVEGRPSVWSALLPGLPLPEQEEGGIQKPPPLTWAGGKLKPGVLEAVLTGGVGKPFRPWLGLRMPAFRHGGLIAEGLAQAHGYPMEVLDEVAEDPALVGAGRVLVGADGGFNCVTCHAVGNRPATQVFETQGVNFDRVHERLRRDYYFRWMADPMRIDADSRMPRYADDRGKTPLIDVLGGDAHKQYEAIWHYLQSL